MKRYTVVLSEDAERDLDAISDQRTYRAVEGKIDELSSEPEKRGKTLTDDLKGFYSVRAAGQRYRIVYQVEMQEEVVTVLVIGIRKEGNKRDVYRVARKRLGKG